MDQKTQANRVVTDAAPDVVTDSAADGDTTACARCGLVREGLPLTWTCSVEDGARVYLCDGCSRESLRAIESRLDSAWW